MRNLYHTGPSNSRGRRLGTAHHSVSQASYWHRGCIMQGMTSSSINPISARQHRDGIRVRAPGRLHMGFLDLHGGLGRSFGSVGLTLDPIATVLHARRADSVEIAGHAPARTRAVVEDALAHLGNPGGVHLTMESHIPEHVGLGSGTQLALAVGVALGRLYDGECRAASIAHRLDRGARSGIGVGAFDGGGFILDGGRGSLDAPPPVLATLDFPQAWRVLLIMDQQRKGLHGEAEIQAFRTLPRFPADSAAHLCRVALMQMLPALREADLHTFAKAIWEVQCRVGDHFAPAQGARFSSAGVAGLLEQAAAEGLAAGQSSWGPTGFVVLPNEAAARARMERWAADRPDLQFMLCSGRNRGGEVQFERNGGADKPFDTEADSNTDSAGDGKQPQRKRQIR